MSDQRLPSVKEYVCILSNTISGADTPERLIATLMEVSLLSIPFGMFQFRGE